jgi:hypothetical protein
MSFAGKQVLFYGANWFSINRPLLGITQDLLTRPGSKRQIQTPDFMDESWLDPLRDAYDPASNPGAAEDQRIHGIECHGFSRHGGL